MCEKYFQPCGSYKANEGVKFVSSGVAKLPFIDFSNYVAVCQIIQTF